MESGISDLIITVAYIILKNQKRLYTQDFFSICSEMELYIEECLNENKKTSGTFEWILNSTKEKIVLDVWNYANEISIKNPQGNIYKFYYYSEIFQCFDTVFLFSSVSTFVLGTTYCIIKHNFLSAHFIMIFLLSLIFFLFHFLSKKTGKSFARRFFLEIQLGLNLLKNNSEK